MSRVTYAIMKYENANVQHVIQYDADTQLWYDRILDFQGKEIFELYEEQGKLEDFFSQIGKVLERSGVPEPQRSLMLKEVEREVRSHADWGKPLEA